MVQEQDDRVPPATPARRDDAGIDRSPPQGASIRQIECEPDDADRTRGTPRSGRGRGVREGEPSGRRRRHHD